MYRLVPAPPPCARRVRSSSGWPVAPSGEPHAPSPVRGTANGDPPTGTGMDRQSAYYAASTVPEAGIDPKRQVPFHPAAGHLSIRAGSRSRIRLDVTLGSDFARRMTPGRAAVRGQTTQSIIAQVVKRNVAVTVSGPGATPSPRPAEVWQKTARQHGLPNFRRVSPRAFRPGGNEAQPWTTEFAGSQPSGRGQRGAAGARIWPPPRPDPCREGSDRRHRIAHND